MVRSWAEFSASRLSRSMGARPTRYERLSCMLQVPVLHAVGTRLQEGTRAGSAPATAVAAVAALALPQLGLLRRGCSDGAPAAGLPSAPQSSFWSAWIFRWRALAASSGFVSSR